MKLTSLIALFTLSLAGVEAIGPDDHLHYKGNFHAPHNLELKRMGVNRVSRCSSSAGALPTGEVCALECDESPRDCYCTKNLQGDCDLEPKDEWCEKHCICKKDYPPT
jgi:hypothetical protein